MNFLSVFSLIVVAFSIGSALSARPIDVGANFSKHLTSSEPYKVPTRAMGPKLVNMSSLITAINRSDIAEGGDTHNASELVEDEHDCVDCEHQHSHSQPAGDGNVSLYVLCAMFGVFVIGIAALLYFYGVEGATLVLNAVAGIIAAFTNKAPAANGAPVA